MLAKKVAGLYLFNKHVTPAKAGVHLLMCRAGRSRNVISFSLLFLILFLPFNFFLLPCSFADYADGDGSPEFPYEIAEPNQLIYMSQHPEHWDKCFILTADINLALADPNTFTTALIAPDGSNAFSGTFDGKDHTISNLTIVTASTGNYYLGLIGKMDDPNAEVKNLGLENVGITGGDDSDYLGGLCGENSGGNISDCYSSSSVTGGDYSRYLGGLCGWNSGSISDCYSTGAVTGGRQSHYLGGLCGSNYRGNNSNCYATVSVSGGSYSEYLGGLCGDNYEGSISNCYATGSVTDGEHSFSLGGLCGRNDEGSISDCYATGSVTTGAGSNCLGGLCGWNYEGSIINCYAIGSVSGSGYIGGLCGYNDEGSISNCFWDVEASGLAVSNGGFGRTTVQMQTAVTFVGWGGGKWTIPSGEYPSLTWENAGGLPLENIPDRTYTGTGTSSDPFMLADSTDLLCLAARQEDWSSCFSLASDIDMNGVSNYLPIGNFAGELNGMGYRILNLTVNEPGSSLLGLIGLLVNGAFIQNLGVENVSITGYCVLGGLCGANSYGSISNCYSNSSVTGGVDSFNLGGLCGRNSYGSISNCYAICSITGEDNSNRLGGLCGYNNYSISNCYSSGSVTGGDDSFNLGGLCGSNSNGNISNCYSIGSVTSGDNSFNLGGLFGWQSSGSISNCYAIGSVTSGAGSNYLGGLCGWNYSRRSLISNCYSTGSVSGDNNLGGLCGYNYDGRIRNCYSTGSVSGDNNLGGLCGDNENGGNISNCYSTGSVTGDNNLGGLCGNNQGSVSACYFLDTAGPDNGYGDPLDDPNMRIQSSFASWDFVGDSNGGEDHWQLCIDGYDYPRLTWQFINPADFLLPGRVDLYDLFTLTHDWLKTDSPCCDIAPTDNPDGIVNLFDYAEFTKHWLKE